MHFVIRHGYALAVWLLLGLIGMAGAFMILVVLPDFQGTAAAPQPTTSPTPLPTTAMVGMSWLQMPPNADCAACHSTATGIGVRAVPALAHPLKGWTNCTACHSDERLVQTAPGHSGIHATDCLLCHEVAAAGLPAPLSRPHRDLQNQACLSCHGSTAPLPADMSHRSQNVCWLCHRLPQVEPPLPQHAVTAGEKDCLTCHIPGKEGPLPADHSSRTEAECLLCHEPREMAPTSEPQVSSPAQISESLPAVPITAFGWWRDGL